MFHVEHFSIFMITTLFFIILYTKYSVEILLNVKQNRDVSRETSLQ